MRGNTTLSWKRKEERERNFPPEIPWIRTIFRPTFSFFSLPFLSRFIPPPQIDPDTKRTKTDREERQRRAREEKTKEKTSRLSFDIEEEEEEEEGKEPAAKRKEKETKERGKTGKKNPFVETTFLPDKEREAAEAEKRERLAKEWMEEEERKKRTEIEITYSFWDGSGHRKTERIARGARVGEFLEKARGQIRELRGVSSGDLLFVKEDLIIPHTVTFHELIESKARGKSGPLFHFDVHEDVRLVSDAGVEKDESHAAKVVERRWFERNKHIFPASRWEVFDPTVERCEGYTIHDSKS